MIWIRAVGRFFMVAGRRGGWVKMLTAMVGWRRKIKKQHWLKRPRAVQKSDQNINDSKCHIWNSNIFIFVQTFQWTVSFLTLQIFQRTCLCLLWEKNICTVPFVTPKNRILEAVWKQMSEHFCISLKENFCSKDLVRFYLMGVV